MSDPTSTDDAVPRRAGTGTRRRLAGLAVVAIVLPLLAALALVWTTQERRDRIGRIPVAIVNSDTIITDPQPMAAGRALSASLTDPASGDPQLDWTLTDSDDATDGLRAGTYYAVLTIPSDFSKAILSTGTDDPSSGQVTLTSNAAASQTVPYISKAVVAAATQALGIQSTQGYLKQVYAGFNQIADGQKTAASSAAQLATGTGQLSQGAQQLDDGAGQLAGATTQLATGAGELASATGTLAGGAADVARGSRELHDGAGRLEAGAGRLAGDAGRLADGATAYARRMREAARAAGVVSTGADRLSGANRRLAADVGRLVRRCRQSGADVRFCLRLRAAHVRSLGVAAGSRVVARGTGGVARGAGALATAAGDLAAGDRGLAGGARALDGAAGRLEASADRLADGAGGVASGATRLDTSAGTLAGGADEAAQAASSLAAGAGSLAASAQQVDDGAEQLSSGLAKAAGETPTYTDDQQDALAEVVSEPVLLSASTEHDNHANGFLVGAIVGVLLWLAALAAAARLDVTAARRLALSPVSSGRIARAQLAPVVLLVVVQAAVVVAVLLVGGVNMVSALGLALLTLLAAASFGLVAHAMRLGAGATGIALFVLLLLLQVVALDNVVPLETAPGLVQRLNGLLPLTAFADGAARLVSGGEVGSVVGAIVVLVAWGLVAYLVALALVRRQRLAPPPGTARRTRLLPVLPPTQPTG